MVKKKNLEWRNCSEVELRKHLVEWVHANAAELTDAIVFLNGQMGAGKSTFARALLEILAPGQLSKGSPTFPLVQEYRLGSGVAPDLGSKIYHIDLYRLTSANELEESGILSQIEEPGALVLVEWANQFPSEFQYWLTPQPRARQKAVWSIGIQQAGKPDLRHFRLQK